MGEHIEPLRQIIVGEEDAGRRLDVFLAQTLPDVSRSQVKKWLDAGLVRRADAVARASELIHEGDIITLPEVVVLPPTTKLRPTAMNLTIYFEDAHLIVLEKPKGVVVHPGAGTTEPTLVEGILYHFGERKPREAADTAAQRPGIVHRLDKDTTGVMVVAKTDKAHRMLAKQFEDKTNLREYLALLNGAMREPEITYESYLYRDPNNRLRYASLPKGDDPAPEGDQYRYAKSLFMRQAVYNDRLTLARVRLFTGRTHQIRVHARELKLPVIGDPLYGQSFQLPQSFSGAARQRIALVHTQMLHARILGFIHPETGEKMAFESPLPTDFREVLATLNDN